MLTGWKGAHASISRANARAVDLSLAPLLPLCPPHTIRPFPFANILFVFHPPLAHSIKRETTARGRVGNSSSPVKRYIRLGIRLQDYASDLQTRA